MIPLFIYLFHYFFLAPVIKLIMMNLSFLFLGKPSKEKMVRVMTAWTLPLDAAHVIALIVLYLFFGAADIHVPVLLIPEWQLFAHFNLQLVIGVVFSVFLLSLVNIFSVSYMHRDPYFHKFFTLYFLFKTAVILLVFAANTQFIFMGWELLGLSSVLLIGFYELRPQPLKNSIRILAIYKIADTLLFGAILMLLHSHLDVFQFEGLSIASRDWVAGLLLGACLLKSGIFPWQWLPRAMEGPTPSSSIFYGALATHLPILLLIRIWPDIAITQPVVMIGIGICCLGALFGTGMARQATDAKNAMAYAITAQLSLIYIELMLGFSTLAFFHCISHGLYRAFEMLKAPSLLHTLQNIESNRSEESVKRSWFLQLWLPSMIERGLYKLAMRNFMIMRRVFDPIDYFLSLKQTRFNKRAIARYSIIAVSSWVLIQSVALMFSHETVTLLDEFFMFVALGLNVMAFVTLNRSSMFLLSLTCSMAMIFDVLASHYLYSLGTLEWVFLCLAVILLFIVVGLRHKPVLDVYHASTDYAYRRKNVLMFILGLTIVGMPGLGGYFLWESLMHHVSITSPHLVMEAFFVMSLNTILLFMNWSQVLSLEKASAKI